MTHFIRTTTANAVSAAFAIIAEPMIREKILPLEELRIVLQRAAAMNEEIAEVSVLGVPDEYWGESVQAAVVLRPDSKLTPEEIRTFCRGKIAGYKIPKKVYVWDELPKNTTGKVCKAEVLKKIKEEN